MIISKTPVRMSFWGGGTDYPAYFSQCGGAALAASIDKYTIITVNPLTQFADYRLRIHYSRVESVSSLDDIQHPSARECLRFMGLSEGLEIHYLNDLPARTGLGSSSSATVGLLTALHAFKDDPAGKEQIAREAVFVEQEMIRENVGCQDQFTCALGGMLHLEFERSKKIRAHPVKLGKERLSELENHLMLFYTGMQRDAHKVLHEQMHRTQSGDNHKELKYLQELVGKGLEILTRKTGFLEFGGLLHEGWVIKRRLSSKVTNAFIDSAYLRARKAGAIGGKLLGAGGGGFLLLFVQPKNQERVRLALAGLREARFQFENKGTHLIFSQK